MSSTLHLSFAEDRTAFSPGEEIAGTATWRLDAPPRSVEVKLCWFTEGKGTRDTDVAAVQRFEAPQAAESRPFRFTAPASPHSFSGQIFSLVWCVELIAEPGNAFERATIVIAPGARRIALPKLEEAEAPAAPPLVR